MADRGANMNFITSQWRTTALSVAVMPMPSHLELSHPGVTPRDPDPVGVRQLEVGGVRALLRLGAGTHPLPRCHPFLTQFKL